VVVIEGLDDLQPLAEAFDQVLAVDLELGTRAWG
jgi:hypothetical protein